ncbi:MAG: hypothetical protein CEO12_115 [Parcubacteria group bacterium Gr01-1014_46]|nr:MAG: hypothetical protein CEO12_115 [Parcubacteria group bacterium Gr01-1014_46]
MDPDIEVPEIVNLYDSEGKHFSSTRKAVAEGHLRKNGFAPGSRPNVWVKQLTGGRTVIITIVPALPLSDLHY